MPPDDRSSCTAGLPGKGEGDDAHLRGRETLAAEERAGRSRLRPILAAGDAACRRDDYSVFPLPPERRAPYRVQHSGPEGA